MLLKQLMLNNTLKAAQMAAGEQGYKLRAPIQRRRRRDIETQPEHQEQANPAEQYGLQTKPQTAPRISWSLEKYKVMARRIKAGIADARES